VPFRRFQRPLDAVQERFGGPPTVGDESVAIEGTAIYTIALGRDRTDRERVAFGWGLEQPGVAGQFVTALLEADQDLEVTGAYLSRTGGGLDANVGFQPNGLAGGLTLQLDQTIQRSADAGSGARVFAGTVGLVTQGVQFFAPTQALGLVLLPDNFVLPAGRAMKLQCENVNSNCRIGFWWRALG
jgi:hypothetical protein